MRRLVAVLVTGSLLFVPSGWAQTASQARENTARACQDGLDNDADGLLDCDDPECAVLVFCEPKAAADAEWAAVVSTVHVGDKLKVKQSSGKVTEGTLVSTGEFTLVLDVDGSRRTVLPADVNRIWARRGNQAGRGAMIGAAIGAGMGLAAVAAPGEGDEGDGPVFVWVPLLAAIYGGFGALIGLAVKKNELVYDRATHVSVGVSPWLGPDSVGIRVAVRF
jgi:hypothetical protein